jgi:hypothetical protein
MRARSVGLPDRHGVRRRPRGRGVLTYSASTATATRSSTCSTRVRRRARVLAGPTRASSTSPCSRWTTTAALAPDDFVVEVLNVAPTIDAVVCPAATEGTPVVDQRAGPRSRRALDAHRVRARSRRCARAPALNNCLLSSGRPPMRRPSAASWTSQCGATDGDGGEGDDPLPVPAPLARRRRRRHRRHVGRPERRPRPTGDPDGDGLTNQDEFDLGTDPHVFDGATPPVLIDPIGGESP